MRKHKLLVLLDMKEVHRWKVVVSHYLGFSTLLCLLYSVLFALALLVFDLYGVPWETLYIWAIF